MAVSSSYAATMTLTGIVKRDWPSDVEVLARVLVPAHGVLHARDDEERDETRLSAAGSRGTPARLTSRSMVVMPPRISSLRARLRSAPPQRRGTARRPPRRSARGAGCAGCRARGSRRSPTSCSTSAAPFRANGSSCASTERSDGTASDAHAAQRVLGRRPHPPALVGREDATIVGAASAPTHVAGGACGMHADEPLAVVEAREKRDADAISAARAERLDRCGANVGVGVPRELDESSRSPSSGYGRRSVAPQKRTAGFRSSQQRKQLRARGRRQPLELGRDP